MTRSFFILLTTAILLISCDSNHVLDEYKTLPETWNKGEAVSFTFKTPDSLKNYNMFINLRNNNAYEFSNLFLIVGLETPSNNRTIDTLEYQMTTPDGQWLGEGFSEIKENKLWYKEAIQFNETGNYTLTIEHALRKNGEVNGVEQLKGITEIGYRLEEHKSN
ncbi:MAG: gliding motility lipoprotein GldH [Flavobacteriaceae bacterium]